MILKYYFDLLKNIHKCKNCIFDKSVMKIYYEKFIVTITNIISKVYTIFTCRRSKFKYIENLYKLKILKYGHFSNFSQSFKRLWICILLVY